MLQQSERGLFIFAKRAKKSVYFSVLILTSLNITVIAGP